MGAWAQCMCLEMDLRVVSIGQVPKERRDRVFSPLFQILREVLCRRHQPSPLRTNFIPEKSPCLYAQILFFPNRSSYCPWTVPGPASLVSPPATPGSEECLSSSSNLDMNLLIMTCTIRVCPSNPADLLQFIYLDENGVTSPKMPTSFLSKTPKRVGFSIFFLTTL